VLSGCNWCRMGCVRRNWWKRKIFQAL